MKIKLETQNGVSVLRVSGAVASSELDVLQAGISKLLGEGKVPLQLDLTQADIPTDLAQRVKLLADETKLASAVAMAKAVKARALKTLDDTAALGAEIKKLKRVNSELGAMAKLLKTQIESQVKIRKLPISSEGLSDKFAEVHLVMRKVFTGLFQEKAG